MTLPRDMLLQGALNAEANRDFPLAQNLYAQAASQYPTDPAVWNAWSAFLGRMHQLSSQIGVQTAEPEGPGQGVPEILHPSFEFRSDLVLFGFTESVVKKGEDEESEERKVTTFSSPLRVVCEKGKPPVQKWGNNPTLQIGGNEMILDLRYDGPSRLEDQWPRTDLNAFLKAPASASGPHLYALLKGAVHRHIDLMDEGAEVILAVWPVLSFTYLAFPAVPFILLLGPKSTGKTQALCVLEELCRNGHRSKGTAASLGDLIQSRRATWLIDQANKLPEDLLHDLTDSYKRGAKRTVTNMDKRGQPHEFETYGAKAFAAHKDFDEDLIDRCIQIEMAPAVRSTEPLLASDQRLTKTRWHLYRFTAIHGPRLFESEVFKAREGAGKALQLSDREWELWWPFETLFDWLQVPMEDRRKARAFYRASIPSTKADLPEADRSVLEGLKAMAGETVGPLVVTSDDLTRKASSVGDYVQRSEIGRILKNHGLIEERSRIRLEGKRVTQWTIKREKLQLLSERWKIGEECD